LSDIAPGLWGRCLKKEHCFQVGAVLSRRPKRSHEQHKVRAPSTSRSDENINRMYSLMLSDSRITVQMIADELQIEKKHPFTQF
jgi:hypothetical protein